MPRNLNVAGQKSAFGELSVANNYPQFQIDFQYGVDAELFETFTATGGTVTEENSMGTCKTGTSVGGYGVLRSKQFLQYKPGHGGLARFTAKFTTGVANSIQWVGLGSLENKLSVGYNGENFGINRRTGGKAEIRTLTVTSGTGSGTADLTLNGVLFNPVLTSGSVQERAQEIADGGTGGVTYTGWRVEAIGDTVVFQAESVDAKSGTYSLASVGAGTFAQTRGGAADGDNWTYQANFNLDPLDGTGSSGMTIDPTKGNVFEISYQWLGFGAITYSIEDPESGNFFEFHEINYANQNTTPSLLSPSMQMEVVAASLGSTTDLTVQCASMATFIQGGIQHYGKPHAADAAVSTSSSSPVPALSIKAANVFNGKINFAEAHLKLISFATSSSGNKPAAIEIYRDATLTAPLWTYTSEGISHIIQDTTASAMSGGELIMAFSLPSTGSQTVDLSPLNITLTKVDTLTVGVKSVNGTIDFDVALTWEEDY